jgi:Protein of unknown function DUF45
MGRPEAHFSVAFTIPRLGKLFLEHLKLAGIETPHLGRRHHTAAFWAALGRVMPDYEARREALRGIGGRLEWDHGRGASAKIAAGRESWEVES